MIEKIKQTAHYKLLSPIQQKMIFKKTPMEQIRLGVKMSELQTFDFWVRTTKPRDAIKGIVMDLVL